MKRGLRLRGLAENLRVALQSAVRNLGIPTAFDDGFVTVRMGARDPVVNEERVFITVELPDGRRAEVQTWEADTVDQLLAPALQAYNTAKTRWTRGKKIGVGVAATVGVIGLIWAVRRSR